jgi:hypothetical protein
MQSIKKCGITLIAMLLFATSMVQASGRDVTETGVACSSVAAATPFGSTTLDGSVQRVACQVARRRLLIIGEIHGTQETPAFVAALVRATSKNRPVRVGLEWPAWMNDYVVTYFASQGTMDDRKKMLRMGYWKTPDGRSSEAMVDLVDTIRHLRQQGRHIDIFLMEPNVPTTPADLQSNFLTRKENGMAKALKAALNTAPSNALVIAYMGSYHTRYVEDTNYPQPSVLQQVIDDHPLYISTQADAGGAWVCQERCGPYIFKAPPKSPSRDIQIDPLTDAPKGITAESVDFPVFTPSAPSPRFKDPDAKAGSQ